MCQAKALRRGTLVVMTKTQDWETYKGDKDPADYRMIQKCGKLLSRLTRHRKKHTQSEDTTTKHKRNGATQDSLNLFFRFSITLNSRKVVFMRQECRVRTQDKAFSPLGLSVKCWWLSSTNGLRIEALLQKTFLHCDPRR
jgi:hypothetical protein